VYVLPGSNSGGSLIWAVGKVKVQWANKVQRANVAASPATPSTADRIYHPSLSCVSTAVEAFSQC